eukprot:FR741607.1.p2 GENE.FR741607.1~~FR741607.1.p2  ORF type:complete len:175 (-),score=26.75 FR741607.1:437-961(-)
MQVGTNRVPRREKGGREAQRQLIGFSSLIRPPPAFTLYASRLVCCGEMGAGKKFHTGNSYDHDYAKRANNPHKREQKLELHRGGGRSRTSGSPWLWTLAVTHCGRFFFFFFFFLNMSLKAASSRCNRDSVTVNGVPTHNHLSTAFNLSRVSWCSQPDQNKSLPSQGFPSLILTE